MVFLVILVAIFMFTVQTVSFKEFNRTFMKNLSSYYFFNFMYFSVVVFIILIINSGPYRVHPATIILASSFGILYTLTILLYMKAMEYGPLSYTTLIFSFGLLIPIFCGFFLWKEAISLTQLLGLFLLLATFYLGNVPSKKLQDKMNLIWFFYSSAAFMGNGGLMMLYRIHQRIFKGTQIYEFPMIAFGVSAIISILLFLLRRINKKEGMSHLKSRSFAGLIAAAGISTAVGNLMSLYLAGKIPAIIQYPSIHGGVVVTGSIVSFFYFKEKPIKRRIAGLIIGLFAIIFISVK